MKKLIAILILLLITFKTAIAAPLPPKPLSHSTSSSDAILPVGISGKASAVTLIPVSYEFIVTVTGRWQPTYKTNDEGLSEYKTYAAVCPAGSTLIRGPSDDQLKKLANCTCNPAGCYPPDTQNVQKGVVRTRAVCLINNVYSYVLTSLLPPSIPFGSTTIVGTITVKGKPDAAHPFVYPFSDRGPTLQTGDYYGSVYNPIVGVNPIKNINFNSKAQFAYEFWNPSGTYPCF